MRLFSVTSANIAVNDTSLKLAYLYYISVADCVGLSSTTLTEAVPKSTEFGEKTQDNGHTPFKVIQGHRFWYQSKASMRLPISD